MVEKASTQPMAFELTPNRVGIRASKGVQEIEQKWSFPSLPGKIMTYVGGFLFFFLLARHHSSNDHEDYSEVWQVNWARNTLVLNRAENTGLEMFLTIGNFFSKWNVTSFSDIRHGQERWAGSPVRVNTHHCFPSCGAPQRSYRLKTDNLTWRLAAMG